MMSVKGRLSLGVFAVAFLGIAVWGCAEKKTAPEVLPPVVKLVPAFPPQKAMEGGDYEGFLAENQKIIRECNENADCDEALFNLGFVYSYPRSPYYSKARGLEYFDRLVQTYPRSVWAYQARAWAEIIRKSGSTGVKKQKDLREELKSREAAIEDLQKKLDRSRDVDIEVEKKERQLLK